MRPEKTEYLILWQNLQILSFTKKTYEKIVKWSRKWQPEKYKIVQSKKNIDIERLFRQHFLDVNVFIYLIIGITNKQHIYFRSWCCFFTHRMAKNPAVSYENMF